MADDHSNTTRMARTHIYLEVRREKCHLILIEIKYYTNGFKLSDLFCVQGLLETPINERVVATSWCKLVIQNVKAQAFLYMRLEYLAIIVNEQVEVEIAEHEYVSLELVSCFRSNRCIRWPCYRY